MGKEFKTSIEKAVSENTGTSPVYKWEILPGTGSTSKRELLTAITANSIKRYAIKTFVIPDKPFSESLVQAQREYTALGLVAQFSNELWQSPGPVAFLPERATIIMEYFDGINVNSLFWKNIRKSYLSRLRLKWFLSMVSDIARIVDDLHKIKQTPAGIPEAGTDWYNAFLDEQIESLIKSGVSGSLLKRVRKTFRDALPELTAEQELCFQHTDFYLNNILTNGISYCVLDMPNSVRGSRYWDISHFIISLEHYKLFRNTDSVIIDKCMEIFLEHFNLEKNLFDSMQLAHTCFSLKLCMMAPPSGMMRYLISDPSAFYINKLESIISKSGG
jgi:serine/threonine protein kinase